MSFVPTFKLYDSTGLNLLYTFPVVQETNSPKSVKKTVVIEGTRGKGCIIIDGGEDIWDLNIRGILSGDDYEALVVAIDAMESAIQLNTKYILKIDKTSSTYYEYKVKRILSINYPQSLRNNIQEYTCVLKVNSW